MFYSTMVYDYYVTTKREKLLGTVSLPLKLGPAVVPVAVQGTMWSSCAAAARGAGRSWLNMHLKIEVRVTGGLWASNDIWTFSHVLFPGASESA